MNWDCNLSTITADHQFRVIFSCSIVVAIMQLQKIVPHSMINWDAHVSHMLWALMFLKTYAKETALSGMARGADGKTFQKWIWFFVCTIAALESDVVSEMAARAQKELSLLHSNTHN